LKHIHSSNGKTYSLSKLDTQKDQNEMIQLTQVA